MIAFDYLAEARAIRAMLSGDELAQWRTRIDDAITAGSTGGEILMALRWTFLELRKSEIALSANVESRIDDYVAAANKLLS